MRKTNLAMKKILLLLLAGAALSACKQRKAEHVERAFYFWKSDYYYYGEAERKRLGDLGVQKLYVKFFEVEHDEVMGNIPIDKTGFRLYSEDSLTVVPTVFIQNQALVKSSLKDMDLLADNIHFLISKYAKDSFGRANGFPEYQMDCDWTPKTRDKYFHLLKKLKALSGKTISCTLRLYPYKYPEKMGVPPVDKATLMCYNLINPLESESKNSILDLGELKAYLKRDGKYPLHLDMALPVYSWMILYQNSQFSRVLYQDQPEIEKVLTHKKDLWYEVNRDTTFSGTYLRVGDRVKYEKITSAQIREAIALLKKHLDFDKDITVSLFHLDENHLNTYGNETLEHFYSDFSQ